MRRLLTTRQPLVAAALVSALVLAGCGGSSTSSTSKATVRTVAVIVRGNSVSPANQQLSLHVGDKIRFQVDADRSGELHVHSSPEHAFDFKPGRSTYLVTFDKPGQIDVEEHVADTLVLRVVVQ